MPGRWLMAMITVRPPLPLRRTARARSGRPRPIIEDEDGGRVFVHGNLAYLGTSATPPGAGSRRCRWCGSRPPPLEVAAAFAIPFGHSAASRKTNLVVGLISSDPWSAIRRCEGTVAFGSPSSPRCANPGADDCECDERSSLLAPQHTSPVYFNDLRGHSVFRAVVRDGLPTRFKRVVVINYAETPGRQPRVERVERLYRRFVEVAIKPQYGDAFDRRIVQRVLEPARKKADLVVQQARSAGNSP